MLKEQRTTFAQVAASASLLFGLAVCGCSDNNVAGGGPSGTEAGNAITAQILVAGNPAPMARVTLIDRESIDGATSGYSANADSNGVVTMENVAKGNYTMEAALDSQAIQLSVDYDGENAIDLGKQTLQKTVYVEKNLADFGCTKCEQANGIIKMRGLNHSAEVTNGKFVFGNLPAGKLNFVFIPSTAAIDTLDFSITANAGDTIVSEEKQPETPTDTTDKDTISDKVLLIDDFEDGDNVHLMYQPIPNPYSSYMPPYMSMADPNAGQGIWDIYPSIFDSTVIDFTPDFNVGITTAASYITADADSNKYIHLNLDFRTADTTQWVSFYVYISSPFVVYDLTSVDSLAFDAWGSGSFSIEMFDVSRTPTDSAKGIYNYVFGHYPISLTSQKTHFKVAMSDIAPNAEERKKITKITFVFRENIDFNFDNFEFIGKDLEAMKSIWVTQK